MSQSNYEPSDTYGVSKRTSDVHPRLGTVLRKLSQLIPAPDYCGVTAKIQKHPNVEAIEQLLRELPEGVAMVVHQEQLVQPDLEQIVSIRKKGGVNQNAGMFATAIVPHVKLQTPPSPNVHTAGKNDLVKPKVNNTTTPKQFDETDLLSFLLDVGFTEHAGADHSTGSDSLHYLSTPHEN